MRERDTRSAARMRRPIEVQYHSPGVLGWRMGRMTDFGWEGARLTGAEALEPEMALEIRFVMPGAEGLDVLKAKVVWSRALRGTPSKHEHGIVFTSAASKVQQTISAAIRYVLQSRKSDEAGAERRRSTRMRRVSEASYHEVGHESTGWRPANVVNLSVHGMQFKTAALLKSGEMIELRLPSADGDQPIVMRGRVVWSQVVPDQNVNYGVEFIAPAPGHEERFEALVQWMTTS